MKLKVVDVAVLVMLIAAVSTAAHSQNPLPKRAQVVPKPAQPVKLPPMKLTNQTYTVSISQLENGQTITQVFAASPPPMRGPMVLSGTWPIAIVGGGEGRVNRKVRAVLTSPYGQTIVSGCGYSGDAEAAWNGAPATSYEPRLHAVGTFEPAAQDVSGPWRVTVSYCDGAGGDTSRALGPIKIAISYNAPRT